MKMLPLTTIAASAIAASAASLAFPASGWAGPCTGEIDAVAKQLSKTDAGMGPTGTDATDPATGAQGSGATSGGQEMHPPTAQMNSATGNTAASAQDVQSQNTGRPTAAEAGTGGPAEASTTGQARAQQGIKIASQSLQQARDFDKAGDENACMAEIAKARAALPAQ